MHGISLIIPVYNEQDNISSLHQEIVDVCKKNKYNFEIIIVDDGSTDSTFKVASSLSPVKVIQLRKNFGQTAALDAGIKEAQHEYLITMDGDSQNDPADIPGMLEYMIKHELDVVAGWRKKRKDNLPKRFVSRGADILRKIIINDNIHDSGCTLKVFKKECFTDITLYGEMHRFIPALLMRSGYKIGEIVVNHRPRRNGISKYNWRRTIKGFIDMITVAFWHKFSVRPLHLLGGIGAIMIFLSFIAFGFTIYNFFIGQGMSETAWPLLTVSLFLGGIQFFISGLIIDVLIKNYFETSGDKPYCIKKLVEN
ncbi:MAG: glycosyltransferase family 2 protein [bacterium]